MLTLSTEHIRMRQQAANKEEALQLLADILAADGLTLPEYLNGLKAREAQTSTYLGQGIAIPHGTPESRSSILNTGVRLVHFPDGVLWDGENKAYLAVVIAAKSDEHLQILQLLKRVLIRTEGLHMDKEPFSFIKAKTGKGMPLPFGQRMDYLISMLRNQLDLDRNRVFNP